jgi:small subunit ribosomal protein S17
MADSTATGASPDAAEAKKPVRRIGVVTSDKMDKTRTVTVDRLVQHPLYHKYVKRSTVLKVHDEDNSSRAGDRVEVEFTRPLSKTKRWKLVRIVQKTAEA